MSAARDFLIEIGTEELPPKALRALSADFVDRIAAGLEKATLAHGDIIGFATPRRLAVSVKKLAEQQPEQHVRRRGPPVSAAFDAAGAPTRAALAFAASCGTTVEALERIEEGKCSFLYFIGSRAGEHTVHLLPALVQTALDQLPIPRRMHWGEGQAMFVRPVHWILMLFGREVVPATLLETQTGRHTHGHRFLAPRPLSLASPAAYERTLREKGHVLADFAARRERIRSEVTSVAAAVEGHALMSEALLDEVTALTEWPVALAGRFEERFLALPREVLICTLEEHQRYFPVEDAAGRLLPAFITVSNIASRDPPKVKEGNERVVRARLSDAAFFWEQDRREPLAARRTGLERVTFQARLGSLGDKARRVCALIAGIAPAAGAAPDAALRAAELAKCDLLTAMVGEFPELQGIMGAYYAQADGEPEEVAVSLREQYLPRSAGDALPSSRTGLALAIADKLDTIAGIFAIGEKPSGTKDPFALRRAALGVQRILIEKGLDLDLRACIERAVEGVRADIERLRAYYLEGSASAPAPGRAAVTTEMFDAVLASRPGSSVDFDARLKALSTFLELPEAASLTAANKRIGNILRKANTAAPAEVDVVQLREEAEMRLYDAMRGLRDAVGADTARRQYTAALGRLALLRPAVDTFFDKVLVMDENPQLRANRLSLLAQLQGLFGGIADLSRLPG